MVEDNYNAAGWMRALLLALALVAADQVVKWIVARWIGPDVGTHRFELAGPFLAFEYVENRGAAFGILSGRTALLTILAVAVGGIFYVLYRREAERNPALRTALTLIAAGAAGNLIDRVRLGYVVDFVAVGIWPKFNVADSCITIAIAILAWQALIMPDNPDERTPANYDRNTENRL